jgi:uncharacterized membrane protein
MKLATTLHTIINYTWSLFLHGLLTLLPLALTLAIFNISFGLVLHWLEPIRTFAPTILTKFPHAEIVLAFCIILFIGFILKVLLLQPIMHAFESFIFKIPLVRPVYSGLKQLVTAFMSQDKASFKKVVVVEFPRSGTYSIGFLTNEAPPELTPSHDKKFFMVFIPTTPNPTSGFLIMAAEDEIRMTDYNRQQAMSIIISGGIIQPDKTNGGNV